MQFVESQYLESEFYTMATEGKLIEELGMPIGGQARLARQLEEASTSGRLRRFSRESR